MQIYCTRLYFKIVFWHVFFLNLAGRGLGRCHRSVALGALELGGVFLQRRLRGPGAPDGRVLRLGERLSVSFRFWTQVLCKCEGLWRFFEGFVRLSHVCMTFALCWFCQLQGPASNGQYLSCCDKQDRRLFVSETAISCKSVGETTIKNQSVVQILIFLFPFVFEFSFSKTVKSYILGGLGQRDYYLKPAF